MDIGFWNQGKILSWHSKFHILVQSNAVTSKIINQKNGRTGQTLHHDNTRPKGAVAALAHLVHHILSIGDSKSNLIYDVFDNKQFTSVQSSDIFATYNPTEFIWI